MEAMYNEPMSNHVADAISCSIRGFRLPRYYEIPNMGLYLEQTTKYINQCIQPLGFENVTSTMIRNYVKHGLITNPEKTIHCGSDCPSDCIGSIEAGNAS